MFSYDNSGWSHAAHIKLGDPSAKPTHKLTVTSETDQRVWISGNTWDWRGQSPSCKPASYDDESTEHVVIGPGHDNEVRWNEGNVGTLRPIDMRAG